MKSFALGFLVLIAFGTAIPADAAVPKPGRYKGTFTIQAALIDPVTDAVTKAVTKKVIPIAAVLDGTVLHLVFSEMPKLPRVEDVVAKGIVEDNSLRLTLGYDFIFGGKFTTSSMKGSGEVTFPPAEDPFSISGQTVKSQCTVSIILTRVGN